MFYAQQHFNMIYSIFGINFPRLDKAERAIKCFQIILRTNAYISFAMNPVQGINPLLHQFPADTQTPRIGGTYDPTYRRFLIGNTRRHDA